MHSARHLRLPMDTGRVLQPSVLIVWMCLWRLREMLASSYKLMSVKVESGLLQSGSWGQDWVHTPFVIVGVPLSAHTICYCGCAIECTHHLWLWVCHWVHTPFVIVDVPLSAHPICDCGCAIECTPHLWLWMCHWVHTICDWVCHWVHTPFVIVGVSLSAHTICDCGCASVWQRRNRWNFWSNEF